MSEPNAAPATCETCAYWSELVAEARGGGPALCENPESLNARQMTRGRDGCGAWRPFRWTEPNAERRDAAVALASERLDVSGLKDQDRLRLQAERDEARAALEKIKREEGRVCAEFETCTHDACRSSYTAWAIADQALSGGRAADAANGESARDADADPPLRSFPVLMDEDDEDDDSPCVCGHGYDEHDHATYEDAEPCLHECDCAHFREAKDATPTGFTLCGAVLWIGAGIVLADMPEGTACMMWREGGGWLVGTAAQLDSAKRFLDAADAAIEGIDEAQEREGEG